MKVSEIHTLFEYNRWANLRLLSKAKRLESDQLMLPGQIGPNSVFGALLHILDGEYFWRLSVQTGLGPSKRLTVDQLPDLQALMDYWEEEADQLMAYCGTLSNEDLDAQFEFRWGTAKPRIRTRWHCLVHLVNHGTQHRAEIGLVLGSWGYSPGSVDFITFVTRQLVKSRLNE